MIRCLSVALLCLSEVAAAQTGASRSDESGYTKALQQFQSGNYASAAKLFEDVEAASPGTTDSLLYEAKALIHLQDFSRSESALRSYSRPSRVVGRALSSRIRAAPPEPACGVTRDLQSRRGDHDAYG